MMHAAPGRYARRHTQGFTLLEMSIVLVIIALVTAMAVTSGIAVVSTARQSATTQKMAMIDQALQAFRNTNDRLPCPADLTLSAGNANYGLEANSGSGSAVAVGSALCAGGTPAANFTAAGLTTTSKRASEGAVPTVTLGLPNDFMYDGWGNKFRYAVDNSMTALGAFPSSSLGCAKAALTIYDSSGTNARSTAAIYALLSHGPNGHGAYTSGGGSRPYNAGVSNASELVNCHCTSSGTAGTYTSAYVQQDPGYQSGHTGAPAYYFDDIVTFKERWQMLVPWDNVSGAGSGCADYIYTVDSGGNTVTKFKTDGTQVWQIGCGGGGPGCIDMNDPSYFANAGAVALDASGNVWVSDSGNNRIQEFTSQGIFIKSFPAVGVCSGGTPLCPASSATGQFNSPWGMAFDSSGYLWVVDEKNCRVQKLNPADGSWVDGLGAGYHGVSGTPTTCGTGNGQLDNGAQYITFDSSGNIYVADWGTQQRVTKYTSAGAYSTKFGSAITGYSGSPLSAVDSVAVDASGNIYIQDQGKYLVKLNSAGTYQSKISDSACGGQDIFVDTNGNPWQACQSSGSVVEYVGGVGSTIITGISNFTGIAATNSQMYLYTLSR